MTFHIASALKSAAVAAGSLLWIATAAAAPLPPLFPTSSAPSSLMRDQAAPEENGLTGLPRDLRRQSVNYPTKAAAGSVVVDIAQTFLYYILGDGTAIRYGIGVGREGFTWSGSIYLGSTVYRIHGTNMPETIGQKVSSGCIRMLNADVIDLYSRVDVGTKIIVLPNYNNLAAFAASPQAPIHPGL